MSWKIHVGQYIKGKPFCNKANLEVWCHQENISGKAHSKPSLEPSREKKENHGKLYLNEKFILWEFNKIKRVNREKMTERHFVEVKRLTNMISNEI